MKFEWNDLFMAMLGAIFVVFGANLLSEGIYHSDVPEVAGYEIEGGAVESAAGGGAAAIVDASFLMATVDPAEGEKVAKKCIACHVFEDGGANKVGPHLYDIVDRDIASISDFAYSSGMKTYGEGKKWTLSELNGFLLKPKEHVPGTIMGFAGIKDDTERAEMLVYLRSLSANPVAMPNPEDAPKPEGEEAAPADGAAVTPASADAPAADGAAADAPAAGAAADAPAADAPAADAPATDGAPAAPAESTDTAAPAAGETPAQPEAATTEPVTPEVLAPETNPVNTGTAPAADPAAPGGGAVTGEGATTPAAPAETVQPEVTQPAEPAAPAAPAGGGAAEPVAPNN